MVILTRLETRQVKGHDYTHDMISGPAVNGSYGRMFDGTPVVLNAWKPCTSPFSATGMQTGLFQLQVHLKRNTHSHAL